MDAAVSLLNSSSWRRDHFTEGIYHAAETIGTHYDLYFLNDKRKQKRVTLFRPQSPLVPLRHTPLLGSDKINLILPLYQKLEVFRLFLLNIEKILLKGRYKIYLTIVYFGKSVKELMTVFQPFILKHNYRSYQVHLVLERNFSRGYALDYGIRGWKGKGDPLLFLCDVDVVFSEDFIQHCDAYTERHRQLYYPIVFSLYNPKVNIVKYVVLDSYLELVKTSMMSGTMLINCCV